MSQGDLVVPYTRIFFVPIIIGLLVLPRQSRITDITILSIVGSLYLKYNNIDIARIYFEKVLAQEPYNSYALHGLGNYYRKTGDHQRSVQLWEKALEHDEGTLGLLARLGDAYRKLGRLDDAGHAYRKGLAQGYDKYNFVGMLKLHCLRGSFQDIRDSYRELLHHELVDTRYVAEAGVILVQSGRRDEALEFYRFARKLQKESPEACRIIDECIGRMGET